MKKYILAVLLMSLILGATACGYQITEDTTVSVVRATPTPEPTPTPEVTPTPEPTPTPAVTVTQTASGVNIEQKSATYITNNDLNLRADCSTEAELLGTIPTSTEITSTGISEDGEWLEVSYNDLTGYVKAEYTTLVSEGTAASETVE
jgi:uncharacterized protein YgiM (DUF1202 family)